MLPTIEIYVDRQNEICISTGQTDHSTPGEIRIPLSDLQRDPARACVRFGEALLNHLALLYPDAFTSRQLGVENRNEENSDYDVALRLIEKSIALKTSMFAEAIDQLMHDAALEDAQIKEFLNSNLSVLIEHIKKYPSTYPPHS